MAQSVKLKDGSYIDASGVWDANKGKTQQEVNKIAPAWKDKEAYLLINMAAGTYAPGTVVTTFTESYNDVMLYVAAQEYTYYQAIFFAKPFPSHVMCYLSSGYSIGLGFYGDKIVIESYSAAKAGHFVFRIFYR